MITTVLFDIDGTLIDSNEAHALSWQQAFRSCGENIGIETLRRLIGMGADQLIPIASGLQADSEQGQRISEVHRKIFRRDFLPSLRPQPGARELLIRLKSEGFTLAIASSASDEELSDILKKVRIQNLFDAPPSRSRAAHSKPCPDILQRALESVGAMASETIMIGDTPYDIEAASRIGVRTIALLCGGWSSLALAEAEAIYRDPADLLKNLATSLLARSTLRSRFTDVVFPLS